MIGIDTASRRGEVLHHPGFVRAQPDPVVGRHQHQHRRARGSGQASALLRNAGAEMTAGDDHRHAAGDVCQANVEQHVALIVGEEELLRIVGEDADAVDALVDHAVEDATLAGEVQLTRFGEWRRRDGKNSRETRRPGTR
jgi:hypothetical protein